jgi:hypothetical protein
MGTGMFRKIITFLFMSILSSCSPVSEVSVLPEPPQCQPNRAFNPTSAKITLAGSVIFSNEKSDYYFNLPENSWTCTSPNSQVTNLFRGGDASTLIGAVAKQNNNTQDVVKSRLDFDGGGDFRSFVNEQCAALGLSYLFQVNGSSDERIYGCQINPQVSSAIMWKKTGSDQFIELAYLPFYQPFVDRLSQVN